jgi:hypothetical protein
LSLPMPSQINSVILRGNGVRHNEGPLQRVEEVSILKHASIMDKHLRICR